jgi:hypothetical protein
MSDQFVHGNRRRFVLLLTAIAGVLAVGALSVNYAFGAGAPVASGVTVTPLAANAGSGLAGAGHHGNALDDVRLQVELAQVRRVTARFHDLDAARAAGYELGWVNGSGARILTGCISNPTAGAMGYHYFNAELMADLTTDLLHPEALVYAPTTNGSLRLAAVEWIVRGQNSDPPGVSSPPSMLGMPMHILVPAVGFYLMHAWVWKHNPAGVMADWNPNVSCP